MILSQDQTLSHNPGRSLLVSSDSNVNRPSSVGLPLASASSPAAPAHARRRSLPPPSSTPLPPGLNPTLRSLDKDTLYLVFKHRTASASGQWPRTGPTDLGVSGQNGILHLESNLSTEKFVNRVTDLKSQTGRQLVRTYISKKLESLRVDRSRLSAGPSFGARGRTLAHNRICASGKLRAVETPRHPR